MSKFQVGKTYFTRSACDHNCIFRVTVLRRTEKTIIANCDGEQKTLRISLYGSVEQVMPKGRYSMAPIVGADRQAPESLQTTEQAERAANEAAVRRRIAA